MTKLPIVFVAIIIIYELIIALPVIEILAPLTSPYH